MRDDERRSFYRRWRRRKKPHRDIGAGGGGDAYVAQAVHFDGNAALSIASLACTNNALFSMSGWFKKSSGSNWVFPFVTDPQGNYNNSLRLSSGTSANNVSLGFQDGASALTVKNDTGAPADEWLHILASVDVGHGEGAKLAKLYINDADVTSITGDSDAAFDIIGNGVPLWIGNDAFGEDPFDAAELWIAPGVSLLTGGDIIEADRRKFITADGLPVDLGADGSTPTGTAPAVFFSGAASEFITNKGTGGVFTLTGAITDADDSEPVEAVVDGGGGGPSELIWPGAIHLDGLSGLINSSLTCADAGSYSFSIWSNAFTPNPCAFFFAEDTGENLNVVGINTGSQYLQVTAENTAVGGGSWSYDKPDDDWHHLLGCVDVSESGAGVAVLYVDDVKVAEHHSSPNADALVLPLSGIPFGVGMLPAQGSPCTGDFADFWFATGSLLDGSDEIPEVTRRKFIGSDLKPVHPDNYPAGVVVMAGTAASFAVNRGSGGAFTMIGSLTNATTSPSD